MKLTQNLMKHFLRTLFIFAILPSAFMLSCKKDDPIPSPKAEFTYDVQNNGFVRFSNKSLNNTKSIWNYGDGSGDVVKDYDSEHLRQFTRNGTYQITLKVTKDNLQDVIVKSISVNTVKGSLLVYKKFSTGYGKHIAVYVDGNYIGTINGNVYYSNSPSCGNSNSVTAEGLTDGTHTLEAKENSGSGYWKSTVNVSGGLCNSIGLT